MSKPTQQAKEQPKQADPPTTMLVEIVHGSVGDAKVGDVIEVSLLDGRNLVAAGVAKQVE